MEICQLQNPFQPTTVHQADQVLRYWYTFNSQSQSCMCHSRNKLSPHFPIDKFFERQILKKQCFGWRNLCHSSSSVWAFGINELSEFWLTKTEQAVARYQEDKRTNEKTGEAGFNLTGVGKQPKSSLFISQESHWFPHCPLLCWTLLWPEDIAMPPHISFLKDF